MDRLTLPDQAIVAFLGEVRAADGFAPLSEHKMLRLGGGNDARVAAWGSGSVLLAVSAAARHDTDAPHWALEVATGPDARTPALERSAIESAMATLPRGADDSLWVQRPAQQVAAESLGYRERRRVLRMDGPLPPAPAGSGVELRTAADDDDEAILGVLNRAFAGHREASGMTRERLDELRAHDWYDPAGVVTAWVDGRLAGLCWTKLHPDASGEVYLLAVDPDRAGSGIGETLAAAGYARLAERGAQRATLWVESDNAPALALYRRLGLREAHAIVELGRV